VKLVRKARPCCVSGD